MCHPVRIERRPMRDLRFWTLKYNPLTSLALRALTAHRGNNLETLVFTATTGRSGTLSLARIFAAMDNCVSFHEPHPDMHGSALINADADSDPYVDFLYRNVKSVNIRRSANGAKYYFESNHMFIKNFHKQVIEDFPGKVKVVHVRRDPVKVANSIYAIGNYPGTSEGNQWWLDPRGMANRIKLCDMLENDPEYRHPFYRCLWYWYEMESRIHEFKSRYPSVPTVFFRTDDIRDQDRIASLFMALGIPFDPARLAPLTRTHSNLKSTQKQNIPLDVMVADHMHDRFMELLATRGYVVTDESSGLVMPVMT